MTYIPPKFGMSNIGNTSGTTGTVNRGIVFAGGNNVTLSQSINGSSATITISAGNAAAGSVNFSAGTTSNNLAAVTFANSNGVSFGLNGSTITGSHNGITSQTNQTIGGYASGNTTGQSSSSTMDARSLSFNGAGNISVGYSAGSVMISGSAAASPVNFSAGTTSGNLGSVVFSNSNGVSFGLNGSTITASAVGGGGGIALANSQTTYTSGTANLVGAGGITVASTTGQAFNISGPVVSTLTATGAVSIFNNAGTISIGAPIVDLGVSTFGNTAGTTGTVSNGMILVGSNNITLSQSTNSNGATVSILGGGGGGAGLSAGTQSVNTGTVNFANSNGITFGMSGSNQITASHNGITSQTNQTLGLSAIGNTTGSTSATNLDARTINFSGAGNVSVGYSGSSIIISGANAAQTNPALSASNGSFAFQTAGFSNANGVTFGTSAGSIITASVATSYAASNHSHGNPTLNLTNLSGTTASASNGLTLSLSAAAMFDAGVSNTIAGGSTFGTMATSLTGGLAFYAGSNIGLSQATAAGGNGSVTINAAGGGGGGIALANSQTTYASGTANMVVAGGAMTIASTTGQSYNFSVPIVSSLSATGAISISSNGGTISIGAPGTSSLSATGGFSISTNGATISMGVPAATTLSRWEYPEGLFTSINVHNGGSLSINHMYVPFNVSGSAMKIGGSLSMGTGTSAATASANISLWMGIYTLNGSTLSLASSGSANNGFQWSQSASSTANSSVNSMRQMTVPMNVSMPPGEYWVAAVISSATTYIGGTYTIYGNSNVASGAGGAVLSPIGANTTANRDAMLFQGIYTTQTSVGPVTIVGSQINNTGASFVQRANFYMAVYNATY